jgi:hypothetical protein
MTPASSRRAALLLMVLAVSLPVAADDEYAPPPESKRATLLLATESTAENARMNVYFWDRPDCSAPSTALGSAQRKRGEFDKPIPLAAGKPVILKMRFGTDQESFCRLQKSIIVAPEEGKTYRLKQEGCPHPADGPVQGGCGTLGTITDCNFRLEVQSGADWAPVPSLASCEGR